MISAIALSTLLVAQGWDNAAAAPPRESPSIYGYASPSPFGPGQSPVMPAEAARPNTPGDWVDPPAAAGAESRDSQYAIRASAN